MSTDIPNSPPGSAAPTIVVGVDGSGPSIEALRLAGRLASSLGAAVHAIACWNLPPLYTGYVPLEITLVDTDRMQEATEELLAHAVEKAYGGQTPSALSTAVLNGPAAESLIEASQDADMLVLGRRGHGGFGGLLLGSVTSACVAHAHCPVLVAGAA